MAFSLGKGCESRNTVKYEKDPFNSRTSHIMQVVQQ